jgi:hypothetical protein
MIFRTTIGDPVNFFMVKIAASEPLRILIGRILELVSKKGKKFKIKLIKNV